MALNIWDFSSFFTWFELEERREGNTVKVISTITGYLGIGIKELKESIK